MLKRGENASGGGDISEMVAIPAFTALSGWYLSTTKRAKGFTLKYTVSGVTYLFSCFDGLGNNKVLRYDYGYTNITATFSDNKISFSSGFPTGMVVNAIAFY